MKPHDLYYLDYLMGLVFCRNHAVVHGQLPSYRRLTCTPGGGKQKTESSRLALDRCNYVNVNKRWLLFVESRRERQRAAVWKRQLSGRRQR